MAVTGRGSFPFNTSWVKLNRSALRKHAFRKTLFFADTDQSMKTIMEDWFFGTAGGPTYYGILKRWTGAAWVKEPLKTYLASTWQAKSLKRWDGAQWLTIDTTGV